MSETESTELRCKGDTNEDNTNCDTKQSNFFMNVNVNPTINDSENHSSKYFKRDIQTINCEDLDKSDNFVIRKVTKKLTQAPCKINKSKGVKRQKYLMKNQRDIRSMTKNSNELIKYTQDFETICNKGGVDVDPEQLQLAIALSQSLQDYEQNTEKENIATNYMTSQDSNEDKVTKIKKTLEQFGFKVKPSVCLEQKAKKPLRKLKRSNYPLIIKSIEQKQQIITDKISEILLETCSCCIQENYTAVVNEQTGYFSKCRLNYKNIISNPLIFCVPGLFMPSESKIGCLLKDWSEIPGREKSPERKVNQLDFKDCILFENHFDILLSGSIKKIVHTMDELMSKSFTKSNSINCNNMEKSTVIFDDDSFNISNVADKNTNLISEKSMIIPHTSETISSKLEKNEINNSSNSNTMECNSNYVNRCLSPDMFSDDSSCSKKLNSDHEDDVSDDELPNVYLSQPRVLKKFEVLKETLFDVEKTHVNDCSDVILIEDEASSTSITSNVINKEIINADTSSKLCLENKNMNSSFTSIIDDNDSYVNENGIVHYESYNDTSAIKFDIDSQKSSSKFYNSGNSFEDIQSSSMNKSINDKEIDLTQSSNEENVDDSMKNVSYSSNHTSNKFISDIEIDLTQPYCEENVEKIECFKDVTTSQENVSIGAKDSFEASAECDDVFVLSDDELDYSSNAPLRKWKSSSKFSEFINDSIPNVMEDPHIFSTHKPDTDPIFEQDDDVKFIQDDLKSQSSYHSISCDTVKNIEITTQRHFSKWYRSSILDPITSSDLIDVDNHCTHVDSNINDYSVTRSSLPDVHLPGIKVIKHNIETNPIHQTETQQITSPVKTPSNSKYFIKTKNITPMADYNSMDTPSMIKELSKYGLKPLKRKRAIQILEHIYEQTHPLVDASKLTNKLKRRKLSDDLIKSMEHNSSIDEEYHNEPEEHLENENHCVLREDIDLQTLSQNDDIYKENCNQLSIREINYNDEDLIFQSREKSKVHGCRVPLHIVFHNYLSSRTLLRDAILKYEPVDIERIHGDLKNIGFKFKPKDLMDFFDRKCITIKTNMKNPASKRRKKQ